MEELIYDIGFHKREDTFLSVKNKQAREILKKYRADKMQLDEFEWAF